jgi:hypothetical protein
MSLSSVQNELYNLSDESLRELNRDICDMLKRRRTSANAHAAASGRFRVGDVVSWSGRYGYNEGTITKVKRVKALVKVGTDYRQWDVPLGMLRKVV